MRPPHFPLPAAAENAAAVGERRGSHALQMVILPFVNTHHVLQPHLAAKDTRRTIMAVP